MKYYLAIDIGASSGRHIIGYKENNEIILDEVYRFKNANKEIDGHLTWDIDSIFKEIKEGIKIALQKYHHIESMSIDTWAVDYVLMDNDKEILPCYAYRDERNIKAAEKVHNIIPFEELYKINGCQFAVFNTIYQLYDDLEKGRLDKATDFLMIPEYFMYKLTGNKVKEYTNAGSTGLFEIHSLKVSDYICEKLGLPKSIMKPVYKPGTVVGNFTKEVENEVGGNIKVVLCPTHDTASAVCGIPMEENAPYISSGTWSLLGIKSKVPFTSNNSLKANFSNEYGPDYIRVQKNIMGLWIIQSLSKEFNLDFIQMVESAKKSTFDKIYDVNDKRFLAPKNMAGEIINWFKERDITNLNESDIINSTYHSLAYSYDIAIKELETIVGKVYDSLYIVGGGAKNVYLNELTHKYTGKKIIALPIEASAIGNIKIQMENKNE